MADPKSPSDDHAGRVMDPHTVERVAGTLGKQNAPIGQVPTDAPPRKTDSPGYMDIIIGGVRTVVSSVKPTTWFSPGQPVRPQAPETRGRQFDYRSGFNYRIAPRDEEGIDFSQLRALANTYPLLRTALERKKDQLVKLDWNVRVKGADLNAGVDKKEDPRLQQFRDFMVKPDRRQSYESWARALYEDLLVIDAPCIEPRRNRKGDLVSLDLIDGATIKRVIDDEGRTPLAPDPAYQQVLKGVPANNLTMDDIIYIPRNLRNDKLYGFSPVEQIVLTINIATRRELHKLEFYTQGTIPDAIFEMPEGWTLDQVKEFREYWNTYNEGNTANRRHGEFVPGGFKPHWTKEFILKDEYDEWLARIIFFALGLSPSSFIKEVNRATAETAKESAIEEGQEPYMVWWMDLLNLILRDQFGWEDIEAYWEQDDQVDPIAQAQADAADVDNAVLSLDEVRTRRGRSEYGIGPYISTPSGLIFVEDLIEAKKNKTAVMVYGGPAPAAPGLDPFGFAAKPGNLKKKRRNVRIPRNAKLDPQIDRYMARVAKFLKDRAENIVDQVLTQYPESGALKLAKARPPIKKTVDEILRDLDFNGWDVLFDGTADELSQIGTSAIANTLGRLEIGADREELFGILNARVQQAARTRAAEMVGMKLNEAGSLIANPNAKWAITSKTRDLLRNDIVKAFETGQTRAQLKRTLMENHAFSEARAKSISQTEISRANGNANMDAWKESGVVIGKQWHLSSDHPESDECNDNVAAGVIPIDDAFPSGAQTDPAHPGCLCDVSAVVEE